MSRRKRQSLKALFERFVALLDHDFLPGTNRYLGWLKQPLGWFVVGALAAALTALFLEPWAWVVVGGLVAVVVLGVLWPWMAMRGTDVEIALDRRRCREGDLVHVRLAIHNRWPWPLWGLTVENGFFSKVGGAERLPVAALVRVPGWSRSEFNFEFRPETRGVYPVEIPELATGFPFGIWRVAQPISVKGELVVWPRTTPLASIPSLGGDIADVIGMLFDRPGSEGDVTGVRPFRHGDRLRSIHWAQTARRDAIVVTERQATARRLVVVAVDMAAFLGKLAGKAGACQRQFETAVRVAASIAQEFHAHHADVRFVMGDLDLALSPDTAGLHRLFDALARFEGQSYSNRAFHNHCRHAFSIVITTSQHQSEWKSGAGTKSLLRLVLVEETGGSNESVGRAAHGPSTRRSAEWITIDSASDVSRQLRHQWDRVCNESLAK